MLVDGTRFNDLAILHGVLGDPNETAVHKRQASRSIASIKRKMNDPKIRELRFRLVKAQGADDVTAVEKISIELSEYEYRTFGLG